MRAFSKLSGTQCFNRIISVILILHFSSHAVAVGVGALISEAHRQHTCCVVNLDDAELVIGKLRFCVLRFIGENAMF